MAIRIYGKRPIQTLPGLETRPTSSRVREAVFNIWCDRLAGATWLDLCAGSGAMGAEALARGVKSVVGIEQNAQACRVIQANWQNIAHGDQRFTVLKKKLPVALHQLHQTFDLIYFDPPYQAPIYEPVLNQLSNLKLLQPGGAIAAEHHREASLPEAIANFVQIKRRDYGQTSVSFFEWQS